MTQTSGVVTTEDLRAVSPAPARRRRPFLQSAWPHVIVIVALVGAAQLVSGRTVSSLIIPQPAAILQSGIQWVTTGYLLTNTLATLEAFVVGFAIGAVVALAVAVLFVELPRLGRFAEPYILAISVIPAIALVPLFVVWLGLGIETKILMGAFATFFGVFVVVHDGLKNVDARLLELGRIYDAGRWQRLVKIRLWAALPSLFSAAKLALPKAALSVVVTEYLAGNVGLGYAILRAGNTFDIGGLFVGVITLTVLIHLVSLAVIFLERVLLGWVPKEKR